MTCYYYSSYVLESSQSTNHKNYLQAKSEWQAVTQLVVGGPPPLLLLMDGGGRPLTPPLPHPNYYASVRQRVDTGPVKHPIVRSVQ